MKKILVVTLVVSFFIPALSFAKRVRYEIVEVKNEGTISGKVETTEKVKDLVIPINIKPKETPEETELEKKTCILHPVGQQAKMYLLSASNEVQNPLVIVENIKKGRAVPKKDFKIDNSNCRFEHLVASHMSSHNTS